MCNSYTTHLKGLISHECGADTLSTKAQLARESFSDWATRLRQSDRGAYASLFKAVSAKLVRYAQRFTRDEASAYDVIQDVFVKLWDIRENLNPESSLQALLYTMTRNAALNVNRKNGYLVHSDQLEGEDGNWHSTPRTDLEIDARKLSAQLSQWIDALPERRKEAFVLSRYHDLSHKEISNIMGLSERTVNTHIFLALKHLRTRLDALQNDKGSS